MLDQIIICPKCLARDLTYHWGSELKSTIVAELICLGCKHTVLVSKSSLEKEA